MKEYCTCISKQHLTTTSPPLQPRDPSTICKKKIVQSPRLAQLTPQSPSCSCAFPAAPGLCRGHHERPRASHHIHFGQEFSCCASARARLQLLILRRSGKAQAPAQTQSVLSPAQPQSVLSPAQQAPRSLQRHGQQDPCSFYAMWEKYWNPLRHGSGMSWIPETCQKASQAVLELWLHCTGVVISRLTRQTRSMFLRQTVQSFEHNIWHVVCDHLGAY